MKTVLITQFVLLLFVLPGMSLAQVVAVSGYVKNASNGKVLENVSIFDKNSGIGTITNQNGFYKLILDVGEVNLTISNGGFKTALHTVEAKSDTTLLISLQPVIRDKNRQKKDDKVHAELKSVNKNDRKGFKLF